MDGIKDACKVLTQLFGRVPVTEFGPKALKRVRERMVELDWSRNYVNKQVNRLKRMFRWAVAEELIPGSVLHNLQALTAIRKGEPGVRETEPVKPVPEAWIEATLPFMSPLVAAMVRLQVLTGARPGEIVLVRGKDIDRTGDVWVFVPEHHKTEHRGHRREIAIGPKAQRILSAWLRDDPEAYLFSPAEAERARHAGRSRDRLTHRYPSHMKRNKQKRKANPKRPKGNRYTPDSYRMAIEYARRKANQKARTEAAEKGTAAAVVDVPEWAPNQLRHNAATAITSQFGIEAARIVLGHKHGFTTEIYTARDRASLLALAEKVG